MSDIESLSFEYDRPFDPSLLRAFLADRPPGVFRGKGILNVADDDRRRIFHLVGERCDVTLGDPWSPGEARKTELVFIGRGLDRNRLGERLSECLA